MDDIEKKLNRGRLGGGWGDGDEGRKAAEAFLTTSSKNIGKRSSVDLDILLQQV